MTRYFLALIAVLVATDARLNAVELIENGTFEMGREPFGAMRAGWDDAQAIGNNIGLRVLEWPYFEFGQIQNGNAAFEFPPGGIPDDFMGIIRPAGAGSYHGSQWGLSNGSGMFGSATQLVDLIPHAGKPYQFSAWLASATRDTDHAVVSIEFFTGPQVSGSSLGSVAFDGNDQTSPFIVGSLNLDGFADPAISPTQDNWTLYRATGTLPPDVESAAVVIRSVEVTGTNNGEDAYVDLVSLQVVPEPATTGLLVAGILACAGMLRRWK
jgi:hypothetical protein